MAPQQPFRKASTTATLRATARQGQHKRQKRVLGEIQETDDLENIDAEDIGDVSTPKQRKNKQKSMGSSLEQLIDEMVQDQRKRITARKQGVYKTYNAGHQAAIDSVNIFFNEHESTASSARQAQLDHLQELLSRKAKIEAAMAEEVKALLASYDAHSRDLEAVVKHKITELK